MRAPPAWGVGGGMAGVLGVEDIIRRVARVLPREGDSPWEAYMRRRRAEDPSRVLMALDHRLSKLGAANKVLLHVGVLGHVSAPEDSSRLLKCEGRRPPCGYALLAGPTPMWTQWVFFLSYGLSFLVFFILVRVGVKLNVGPRLNMDGVVRPCAVSLKTLHIRTSRRRCCSGSRTDAWLDCSPVHQRIHGRCVRRGAQREPWGDLCAAKERTSTGTLTQWRDPLMSSGYERQTSRWRRLHHSSRGRSLANSHAQLSLRCDPSFGTHRRLPHCCAADPKDKYSCRTSSTCGRGARAVSASASARLKSDLVLNG